jgi:bacillithiol synthase
LQIKECRLNQSKFISDYMEEKQPLKDFFDYSYQKQSDYFERQKELSERNFQREALALHLLNFNKKYRCSSETVMNIEKLLDENSVVVVGGQQSGVLTGPLYTIHKIITIIKLAKAQETKLSVPVVPVFWIAGEDHDFDEINHIFSVVGSKIQKRKVDQRNNWKKSVSDLELDKEALKKFVIDIFLDNHETNHTSALLEEINHYISISNNYVDFFSFMIHKLFKGSGIVLLDSHNKELRKLEVPFLKQLVENNEVLHQEFLHRANGLSDNGYGEPIDRSENNAHLFFHHEGTRLLLERVNSSMFSDKQRLCSFSKAELVSLIEREPENFSNNVVTRPLMQEYLLPVLAFVGGPGEIAYWATLKEVFHLFKFKVPPVVPRLSMTFVEPQIAKWLEKDQLSIIEIISNGAKSARNQLPYWEEKSKVETVLENALTELEKVHSPLKDLVDQYDKGLERLANKNELIIKRELSFLAEKIEESIRQKYDYEWLKLDMMEANIRPNDGLQERSLNIMKYLNEYGFDFVANLIELPYELNDTHKLIYLN